MGSKNQSLSPEKYIRERARGLQIGKCYWTEGWEDCGMASVIVTRCHKQGTFTVGCYSVDTYCLGVKDSFYSFNMSEYDYKELISRYPHLKEVSYNEAHNLIFAAMEFALDAGIDPHKSWNTTKYILEEDDENIPLIDYEMGKNGEYLFCAYDKAELDKYLPLLRKTLGDDVKFVLNVGGVSVDMNNMGGEMDDEEELSDIFMKGMSGFDKWNKNLIEEEVILPVIPKMDEPSLNHPEILDLFEEYELSEDLIKQVLALPPETLRIDLEKIIRYQFDTNNADWCQNGTMNAVIFLEEVGNESSLDVLLDSLRMMDIDYEEVYFGDAGSDCYIPTLTKLAKDHLEKLESFLHEEHHYWGARAYVQHAAVEIAYYCKEKWDDVVKWYQRVLTFYCEALPKCQACDSSSAGFAISVAMDLYEESLLDDMLRLLDTGLVNDSMCGKKEDVIEEIKGGPIYPYHMQEYDIFKRYEHLIHTFGN